MRRKRVRKTEEEREGKKDEITWTTSWYRIISWKIWAPVIPTNLSPSKWKGTCACNVAEAAETEGEGENDGGGTGDGLMVVVVFESLKPLSGLLKVLVFIFIICLIYCFICLFVY